MAERAELNIERFISDCQILVSLGIYTQSQIDKLVADAARHEYRICKRIAKYVDYSNYIKFELAFYENLSTTLVGANKNKQNEVLCQHQKRIHFLFRRAISKFKEELNLWYLHFQFCIDSNNFPILESSVSALIRFHFSDPLIWEVAAHWLAKVDMEIARKLLEKGLRVHPRSAQILTAHFDFFVTHNEPELGSCINLLKDNLSKTHFKIIPFKHCYNTLTKTFEEMDVLNELLETLKSYTFPEIANFLFSRLLAYNEPLAYNTCLFIVDTFPRAIIGFVDGLVSHKQTLSKLRDWGALLCRCYNKFESGESNICLEKIFLFFSKLNLPLETDFTNKVINWKLAGETYAEYLSATYKFRDPENMLEVFENVCNKFSRNSAHIVKIMMQSCIFYDNKDYLIKCLRLIKSKHVNHLFPFISMGLDTVYLKLGHEYIKNITKKYFNRSAMDFGYISRISQQEIYIKDPDYVFIRSLFEKYVVLQQDTSSLVDFWIKYIQMEMEISRKTESFNEYRVNDLYHRAIKQLSGPSEQEFTHKYTILKTKRPHR